MTERRQRSLRRKFNRARRWLNLEMAGYSHHRLMSWREAGGRLAVSTLGGSRIWRLVTFARIVANDAAIRDIQAKRVWRRE